MLTSNADRDGGIFHQGSSSLEYLADVHPRFVLVVWQKGLLWHLADVLHVLYLWFGYRPFIFAHVNNVSQATPLCSVTCDFNFGRLTFSKCSCSCHLRMKAKHSAAKLWTLKFSTSFVVSVVSYSWVCCVSCNTTPTRWRVSFPDFCCCCCWDFFVTCAVRSCSYFLFAQETWHTALTTEMQWKHWGTTIVPAACWGSLWDSRPWS